MTRAVIHRVTTLDLKVAPWAWPFARERRAEIAAHFAVKQAEKPQIFNGRMLLARDPVFSQERFSARYFETDFASFLAWRDWGFPDRSIFNGFAMGALRSVDGAFLLGEMGPHTANAGRIYFPAGTPDVQDIRDGTFDAASSIAREVEEETGLTPSNYRADTHWHCVVVEASVALIRVLHVDMAAEPLRTAVKATLASQTDPELTDVHLVRGASDLTADMPPFVTAFLEAQLSR
jgi:8-oxo-dGTP pyrophosphatase MutT (NUDIX family)